MNPSMTCWRRKCNPSNRLARNSFQRSGIVCLAPLERVKASGLVERLYGR